MSRVLVTGATGFIGGHLVSSLAAEGQEVRCLVRRTSVTAHLQRLGVELTAGDVRDPSAVRRAVRGCEVVYHLAGKTSARRRRELYEVNARGPELVARACAAQCSPPLLILVSSLAAAGPSPRGAIRTEADPARPISDYGRSKRAGERAVLAWSRQLPLSIVRPGIVFGPRNREMLPMFRAIARLGVHVVAGFTPYRLSLIHQADVLEVLARVVRRGRRVPPEAALSPAAEGVYFATTAEYPTYPQLGRMIARALRTRRTLVWAVAEPLVWLIAAGSQVVTAVQGCSSSLNVDKIREATAGDWICSDQRVRRELGFQPPRSLQHRLDETAVWYRAHGWL